MNQPNAKQPVRAGLLIVALLSAGLPMVSAAHAESDQVHGRIVEFILHRGKGAFEFIRHRGKGAFDTLLHQNVLTVVECPGAVIAIRGEYEAWIGAALDEDNPKRLLLKPHVHLDRVVNIQVEVAGGISTSLTILGADDPRQATKLAVVIPATEKQTRDIEVQRQVFDFKANLTAKHKKLERALQKRERNVARRADEHVVEELLEQVSMLTAEAEPLDVEIAAGRTHGVRIGNIQGIRMGSNRFFISFDAENRHPTGYELADLKLFDEGRDTNYAKIVRAKSPVAAPDGVIAVIPTGKTAKVVVEVDGIDRIREPMSLMLTEAHGLRPVHAAIRQWELVPVTPPYKPAMSLHVQAIFGGIWLANPQDDKELDPTSLKGLGVKIGYELSERLSFEADIVGASSGESRFEDVDFNGQQGDLVRSAKLGRVTLGGVLRLNRRPHRSRYIPVVRLGLGLQGASHNAEFEVGGGRMAGPEVGFEFQVLGAFGGGVDVRLGESLQAGIAVSTAWVVATTGEHDGLQSLEVGVHLGYSWKP